ncbi:hypothetical protein FB451DRAFT_1405767 [Mycena latifolia]|nr:hypothetical protein FB451DRAFT_1405767 [Mycena latifolia]
MAPLARATEAETGRAAPALLAVWIYFNVSDPPRPAGSMGTDRGTARSSYPIPVLLPLLVATFLFSKRARRHPALVNVCMTWILSGVFSLLLFYAGQASGPEPQKALCIAQTSLLYGITPMWSVAVLVLLYNMVRILNARPAPSRAALAAMLSAPYAVQLAFSAAALAASRAHPDQVTRARRVLYCALHLRALSLAMALFTAIVGVVIGAFMVYLALRLYRTWHGLRDAGHPGGLDVQLLLRVLVFGVYLIFGFAVNIISMVTPRSIAPDMYAATMGTAVFLVFGTQADVLRTWCFWLAPAQPAPLRVYLPREPSWRSSLDLTKSAVPPPEDAEKGTDAEKEKEKEKERQDAWNTVPSIAWGDVRPPPAVHVAAARESVSASVRCTYYD